MKPLFFILSLLLLTSCAESNFDVKVESVPIDCFEVKNINTDTDHFIKLNSYSGEKYDELILYANGIFKTKLEKVEGYLESHPIQKEKGLMMQFPSFSTFKTETCTLVLEHRYMDDRFFVVTEQSVVDYFESKNTEGGTE